MPTITLSAREPTTQRSLPTDYEYLSLDWPDLKQWHVELSDYPIKSRGALVKTREGRGRLIDWAITIWQCWKATGHLKKLPSVEQLIIVQDNKLPRLPLEVWGNIILQCGDAYDAILFDCSELELDAIPPSEIWSTLFVLDIAPRTFVEMLLDFSAHAGNIYGSEDLLRKIGEAPATISDKDNREGFTLLQQLLEAFPPNEKKTTESGYVPLAHHTGNDVFPTCITQLDVAGSLQLRTLDWTIPRWLPGAQLNYYVGQFGRHTLHVRANMWYACRSWCDGHNEFMFKEVFSEDDCNFVVRFESSLGEKDFAKAFFPGYRPEDCILKIGPLSFQSEHVRFLYYVLCHELGHILGLRHELWDKDELEKHLYAVSFSNNTPVRNLMSVMNHYNAHSLPLLQIHDDDRNDVRSFYRLPNGFFIDGYPIRNYVPTPFIRR